MQLLGCQDTLFQLALCFKGQKFYQILGAAGGCESWELSRSGASGSNFLPSNSYESLKVRVTIFKLREFTIY